MTYNWKLPGMYSVSAQDAWEELDRIYQERGKIETADVVNESRPEDAVLHPCFEWRDDVAAEKYREEQARQLCRCIVVTPEQGDKECVSIRAVCHVQGSYYPTQVIVKSEDKFLDLYQSCLQELKAVREKFSILSNKELIARVFSAIDVAVGSTYETK